MSKKRRMRLPNGFGQISEIRNARLRKPFRAMVTVGKTEEGRPICRLLKPEAYFSTYNEAYAALIEYNKRPYDIMRDITVQALFDKWFKEKSASVQSKSVIDDIKRTWRYCSTVYDMPMRELKAWHIKDCMDNGEAIVWGKPQKANVIVQRKIKTLFNQLFDYALSYDLVDKNHARNLKLPENITREIEQNRTGHISYTDEEMSKLWNNADDRFVQMTLVQCYSGWRPKEIIELLVENVDLENWTFTGGLKTDAGRDRIVPIHSGIREIVREKYNEAKAAGSKFLFLCPEYRTGKLIPITYPRYSDELSRIIKELDLNPEHKPHDARKQFVTMGKKYGMDEYAIKRIVGHSIKDITERVYTDRTDRWLHDEVEKIKIDCRNSVGVEGEK